MEPRSVAMELLGGMSLSGGSMEPRSVAMEPRSVGMEMLGVSLSGGAWVCSLATTLMSTWLTLSTELLPTESYELGLWETCVVQELGGGLECRPYDSLLGLPPPIQLGRGLMLAALGAGLLGLLLAVPGLQLVNSCPGGGDDLRGKRRLRAAAGGLSLVAGVLVLVPVSYVAHITVLRFHDDTVPEVVPRWEFGDALFCGWTAGVLHLAGGAVLLASCRGGQPAPPRTRSRTGTRTRSVYV